MKLRLFALGLAVALPLGCVAPAAQRADVPPAPVDVSTFDFRQLLTRARQQATGATEAFYLDNWRGLEQAAGSLEQTARLLPRTEGVNDENRQRVSDGSIKLADFAKELGEAARSKDVEVSTSRLASIGLMIRELRSESPMEGE